MPTGPDFIGIGMQKCGSTYLYEVLRRRSDIVFPALPKRFQWDNNNTVDGLNINTLPKEVHFLKGRNETLDWPSYLSLFDHDEAKCKTGEITPLYADASFARVEQLKSYCPDVRLFALLRHPVERDWSAIRMIAKRKNLLNDTHALLQIADYSQIITMGNYAALLKNWLEVFPPESFWFGKLEDLQSDPASVLNSLAAHLNIKPFVKDQHQTEKFHEGPKIHFPTEVFEKLRSRHQNSYQKIHDLTGIHFH